MFVNVYDISTGEQLEFNSNQTKYVLVEAPRLKELEKREAFLICLEGAGVDNWEGYDYAIESYQEDYPNDDMYR